MKTNFYIIANSTGSVRTVKAKPNLNWDEIAVEFHLELPDHLFQKPQLQAKIVITNEQTKPIDISPEAINNIQDAIQATAGIKVKLEIVKPEQNG